jgi:hypothetical protein
VRETAFHPVILKIGHFQTGFGGHFQPDQAVILNRIPRSSSTGSGKERIELQLVGDFLFV